MLSHNATKPEFSVICAMRMPATAGNIPQMFIKVLYLPVLFIIQLNVSSDLGLDELTANNLTPQTKSQL